MPRKPPNPVRPELIIGAGLAPARFMSFGFCASFDIWTSSLVIAF
jgi:hypothetical protein